MTIRALKPSLLQALLPVGAGLLFMTVIVGLQMRSFQALQTLAATAPPQAALQTQEQQEKLRLQLLRETPSFGYNNLVADWAFLSFLQYFGDTDRRSQVGYGVSPEFFEVIVDKDPYFVTPYLFLSTSTSLFAGEPERTVEIMTRGTAAMTPEVPAGGYQVWRLRGIDQLLFLGDGAGAQQSFETAASWADQSSDPAAPSVAEASRQTAAFLAQNPVSKAAQISAWIQVSNLAVDERTQRLAVERIQALGGEILQLDQGRITVRYRSDE